MTAPTHSAGVDSQGGSPQPPVRYAKASDGAHIAYQSLGDGPVDLLLIHGGMSHVERFWDIRGFEQLMRGLARHGRVTHFDKRGVGLSDRLARIPTYEARMDDMTAVLDALPAERAVLIGSADGVALATLFAATHPDRVAGLVLEGSYGLSLPAELEEDGKTLEAVVELNRAMAERWDDPTQAGLIVPSLFGSDTHLTEDEDFVRAGARLMRNSVGIGDWPVLVEIYFRTDASAAAPMVQAPCVVYRRSGWATRVDAAALDATVHRIASLIPGARIVEVDGYEFYPWTDRPDAVVDAVGDFLASLRSEQEASDRVLATVLFTDIVSSTDHLNAIGDAGWKAAMAHHNAVVRSLLHRYRGMEMDSAGDGFFATFDGPSRAVRCAQAIVRTMREAGIDVRAGLHTGEVERIDGKAGGAAVVIGARIAARAAAGDVLVSRTVRDLVVGSDLRFTPIGKRRLKGIPDLWELYQAQAPAV